MPEDKAMSALRRFARGLPLVVPGFFGGKGHRFDGVRKPRAAENKDRVRKSLAEFDWDPTKAGTMLAVLDGCDGLDAAGLNTLWETAVKARNV